MQEDKEPKLKVSEQQVSEQQVSKQQVSEQQVSEQQGSEQQRSEQQEPQITVPEIAEPEIAELGVMAPEKIEPIIIVPDLTAPEIAEPQIIVPEITEPEMTETEQKEAEYKEAEYKESDERVLEQKKISVLDYVQNNIDIMLKKAFAYKANLNIYWVIHILCIIGFVVFSTLFINEVIIKPYRNSKSAETTKNLSYQSLTAQDSAALSNEDPADNLDGEEMTEVSDTTDISETADMSETAEVSGTAKVSETSEMTETTETAETAEDTTWAEGILAQEERLLATSEEILSLEEERLANAEGILVQDEEFAAITEDSPAVIELTPTPVPKKGNKSRRIPFKELLGKNEDVKGWITIPDSNVDYAVVQSSKNDPEYYLYKGLDKKYLKAGTLFLDIHSSVEKNTQNLVIHGHNMVSTKEKMFHMILEYKDLYFYKKHPVFTFDTINQTGEWKVFAVFVTNGTSEKEPLFDFMKSTFASSSEFLNFVYQVRIRSILSIDTVDINEKDQLIMLSTCSNYELGNYRSVIVARKVREGEDTYVDVGSASKNKKPLYPNGWYKHYGGKAPKISTFEKALKAGKINWYTPYDEGKDS